MTLGSLGWLVIASLLVLGPAPAAASHLKDQPRKHKVVYHLSEAGVDQARFVLGNIATPSPVSVALATSRPSSWWSTGPR
jgi:hypothetical protein